MIFVLMIPCCLVVRRWLLSKGGWDCDVTISFLVMSADDWFGCFTWCSVYAYDD